MIDWKSRKRIAILSTSHLDPLEIVHISLISLHHLRHHIYFSWLARDLVVTAGFK